MRSSIQSNYEKKGLIMKSRMLGVSSLAFIGALFFALVTTALCPSVIIGCHGAPSPQIVMFLNDGTVDNPNYPAPEVGPGPDDTKRVYVIDEDTTKIFDIFWDTMGSGTTVRVNDGYAFDVTTYDISSSCDWWPHETRPLIPLPELQNFLTGGGGAALPMIEADSEGNKYDKMAFISEAPTFYKYSEFMANPKDPIRQTVFAIVPIDNDSNNPVWRRGTSGASDRGYTSNFTPYPITATEDEKIIEKVFKYDPDREVGPNNCPPEFSALVTAGPDDESETTDDRIRVLRHATNDSGTITQLNILPFCNPEDPYTVPVNDSDPALCAFIADSAVIDSSDGKLDWLFEGGTSIDPSDLTSDYQRMVSIGTRYKSENDPEWEFIGMGIQLDVDSTNMIGGNDEVAYSTLESGRIECSFTVPTVPFFLQTEVSVTFLYYLKGATLEWYELKQTWDEDFDKWVPAGLPVKDDDPTWLDTDDTAFQDLIDEETLFGPFETNIKGYWLRPAENPENQAKTMFAVRDNTPPAYVATRVNGNKYTMGLPDLTGTTGDTLVQGGNDEFVEITVFDNNPYGPYQLMYNDVEVDVDLSDMYDELTGTMYPGNKQLNLELFYNAELYDYAKIEKTDTNFPNDSRMTSNLFKRRMVWAKGAFGDGSRDYMSMALDSGNMEYDIFDSNCVSVKSEILDRINTGSTEGDCQLINEGLETGGQASFSAVTFKVPVSAFKEPLPLHAYDDSATLSNKKLKWFPLIHDASGNPGPVGDDATTFLSDEASRDRPSPTNVDLADIRGSSEPDYPETENSTLSGADIAFTSPQTQGAASELLTYNDIQGSWGAIFTGTRPDTDNVMGYMGTITVADDEPPQIFIYVTDTKYNKTYRFGLQNEGDGARGYMMKPDFDGTANDGWCDKVQQLSSFNSIDDSNLSFGVRGYDLATSLVDTPGRLANLNFPSNVNATNDFEPKEEIVFSDKIWSTYNEYIDAAVENDTFNPSAGYPSSLPGCWVDEDTRLLFHVVAYDNCSTYRDGDGSSTPDEMSVFDKKEGGSVSYGNGIASLDWKIKDNGQEFTNQYMDDYVFRNPSVDDNFDLIGEECSVEVTAEDDSGNTRIMRIVFYVMNNNMQFRSIEEKSGRGSKTSWF